MTRTTIALSALALGALALTTYNSDARATGRGGANSQHQFCHWYRQKAMSTGDEYWWNRWRRCMRNHEI